MSQYGSLYGSADKLKINCKSCEDYKACLKATKEGRISYTLKGMTIKLKRRNP